MSYDKAKNENQEQCNCGECIGNTEISKKTEIETPYLLLIFKGPLPIAYPRRYLVYSDRTVVSTECFRIISLTELHFERLRSVLPRPQGKVKVFSID